jgi:hypothetical protein
MKKTNQNGESRGKTPRRQHGSKGRWEFKSQTLHALGADGSLSRPVYRTASGELRFLAL